jgi:UDP-N-acetylglucosamine acyltransferase
VGLQRHGYSDVQIKALRAAFKTLYRSKMNTGQALEALKSGETDEHVRHLVAFVEDSKRGVVSAFNGAGTDEE